jgi:hypothetical protein
MYPARRPAAHVSGRVYKLDGEDFSYGFKVADDPDRVSFPKL